LNSRIGNWPTAVTTRWRFSERLRWDQRSASGGESTGPIPVDDPWGAFADDQLGLMDHLGIHQFFYMGYCIGGPFVLKLTERAPERVVAGVLCQPVGHRPENPDVMYTSGQDVWAKELRARRPEVSMETIEKYLHNLYRVRPDFVYSVSRDFVRSCQTPMLVLPDDTPAHAYQTSVDIASLAPNAEVTVYPWKDPPRTEGPNNQPGAYLPEGPSTCDSGPLSSTVRPSRWGLPTWATLRMLESADWRTMYRTWHDAPKRSGAGPYAPR
jgi:pimeloyl-ACP methyl ester carboxylesterase